MTSLQSSLDSMKTTAQSLNEELGTDLLAQLSVDDQREVDKLNDQIQTLTVENRQTLKERVRVNSYASLVFGDEGANCNNEIIVNDLFQPVLIRRKLYCREFTTCFHNYHAVGGREESVTKVDPMYYKFFLEWEGDNSA